MKQNKDSRAKILAEAISILDAAFDVGDACVLPLDLASKLGFEPNEEVSNGQYDSLRQELKELNPNIATPTLAQVQIVGYKIEHNPPLTSIEKASHEDAEKQRDMLFDWLERCTAKAPADVRSGPVYDLDTKESYDPYIYNGQVVTYPRNYFYQAYKLDGAALGLYYENGKLVRAGLRPRDGINGEDVTEQVKYVRGIRQELPEPWTCSIRGEMICLLSDFERVQQELKAAGEEVRANPRNHTAGGIRQFKNPEKVKDMRLSFVAYSVEGLENPPWKTEIERAIYCNKNRIVPFVQCRPFSFYQLEEMEKISKGVDYETDGVIIGVNDLHQQELLGRHGDKPTGNPRGKIAWKYKEDRAAVKINRIIYQTGRSGSLTPVAEFDAVHLAGTMVQRATLHNFGFMIRNKIGVGTVVEILKAGKIIPKVVGVSSGQVDFPEFPKTCPSCGDQIYVEVTGVDELMTVAEFEKYLAELRNANKPIDKIMFDLLCNNGVDCPAQKLERLKHFLTILGVLGIGDSRLSVLIEGGKLNGFADFYKITEADCVECGLTDRQSLLMLAGIQQIVKPEKIKDNDKLRDEIAKKKKSKQVVPLWKIFASFGIESAGKSAGKALSDHFRSIDAIRKADVSSLEEVGDIGSKTADVIHKYLTTHTDSIDELMKFIDPELPKDGPLNGQKFCLSGGFPDGKSGLEADIESRGGKVVGSVGKSTTYLVQGDAPGADKAEKAAKYGVSIISFEKLRDEILV